MHLADGGGRGVLVHAVVERIGKGPDPVFSTECCKGCLIQVGFRERVARSVPCSSTDRNAFWGMLTEPTFFMRFLPSFCFSSNLRFA